MAIEYASQVSPSNYAGQITLRRAVVDAATYVGSTLVKTYPTADYTSPTPYVATNPQPGNGVVYDLDAPGVDPGFRIRVNFAEYAVTGNSASTMSAII